jgi:glucose/arabinose dehydrogenase
MDVSAAYARMVAMIGGAMILLRRQDGRATPQALGGAPAIPQGRAQSIPTMKMPTARGWRGEEKPVAAPGLRVNAFARGLKHPRWMQVMPDGSVAVAESLTLPGRVRTPFDYAILTTMRRAAAIGPSPNRVMLLVDADRDGVAETRHVFLDGQNQPFGMAVLGDTFYLGNTDALLAFPYRPGQTRITTPGRRVVDFQPAGHWTRSLLASPDGRRLYVGVGSLSNIGESGMAVEEERAAIHEVDLATGERRIFASGLRNPVGQAWEPTTGALWTVVNERDGLGDETPPDYLTSVADGGFYGWPYCYWGRTVDDRVQQDPAMVAKALTPDYALGGHTASLGLCWLPEGTLPGYGDGMVIGQHGSWNRSTLSGYRVIHVPFAQGRPSGPPRDILTGFLAPDERFSYGRPVGVTIAADGALLVADDVGDVIWRVTGV